MHEILKNSYSLPFQSDVEPNHFPRLPLLKLHSFSSTWKSDNISISKSCHRIFIEILWYKWMWMKGRNNQKSNAHYSLPVLTEFTAFTAEVSSAIKPLFGGSTLRIDRSWNMQHFSGHLSGDVDGPIYVNGMKSVTSGFLFSLVEIELKKERSHTHVVDSSYMHFWNEGSNVACGKLFKKAAKYWFVRLLSLGTS